MKSEDSVCKLVYSRLSTAVNTNIIDEQTPIYYRKQERVGRNKHGHASHRETGEDHSPTEPPGGEDKQRLVSTARLMQYKLRSEKSK